MCHQPSGELNNVFMGAAERGNLEVKPLNKVLRPVKPANEAVDRPSAFPTRRQWFFGAAGAVLGGSALPLMPPCGRHQPSPKQVSST